MLKRDNSLFKKYEKEAINYYLGFEKALDEMDWNIKRETVLHIFNNVGLSVFLNGNFIKIESEKINKLKECILKKHLHKTH